MKIVFLDFNWKALNAWFHQLKNLLKCFIYVLYVKPADIISQLSRV